MLCTEFAIQISSGGTEFHGLKTPHPVNVPNATVASIAVSCKCSSWAVAGGTKSPRVVVSWFFLGFFLCTFCLCLTERGREDFAKRCGKGLLERRLALLGSMGRCAFAHIIQLWECPGEVRATQRAFLLPYQEGGSHEGGAVQARCSCGNAQGMCYDWFAPGGSRR